jgi:hypothetical protein
MSNEAGYQSSAPTPLVTTAETVVLLFTTPSMNQPSGSGAVISAYASVTTGTAAAALTVRIRQGSLTGPVVGAPMTEVCAAAAANQAAFAVGIDGTTDYPSGQVYVVTVQQGSATGNGVMQYVVADYTPISSIPG